MRSIRSVIVNPEGFIPRGSYNPHNVHAFMLCHEFGLFAIVYASHLQDALDIAVDEGFLDCMQIEEDDIDEDTAFLGNASEPFDIQYLSVNERY